MSDKYYIPKIEEFYIGFEYEFGLVEKGTHTKLIIEDAVQLADALHTYRLGYSILVKYLDSEDIESLGFVRTDIPTFKRAEYTIEWMKDEPLDVYRDNDCIFSGTIKNISELKRLLTQLGIDYEKS